MRYQIVSDSSSNVLELPGVPYASVPLKIITRQKEYVDDAALDVAQMVAEMAHTGGRSSSSCPNAAEWESAFGDADAAFAVTITSQLSGSYAAAMSARDEFLRTHEGAQAAVFDSLSAGPELRLLLEKLRLCVLAQAPFERIEAMVRRYQQHTHLVFMLRSLTNLARNGRVSPAAAGLASVLGICLVGRASDEGTLEPRHKCRGEKKALRLLLEEMKAAGFAGGKVRISHCMNEDGARQMREAILAAYPQSDVQVDECRALCSYYAEKGGLLIGFEDEGAEG